jgi:hypothetical protein
MELNEYQAAIRMHQLVLMRILPYPHLRSQRLGVVLTFVNIRDLKGMTKQLQFVEDAWRFAEGDRRDGAGPACGPGPRHENHVSQ